MSLPVTRDARLVAGRTIRCTTTSCVHCGGTASPGGRHGSAVSHPRDARTRHLRPGTGVYGEATSTTGETAGVVGVAYSEGVSAGVLGLGSGNSSGVRGVADEGQGVLGQSTNGIGVTGSSINIGVLAFSVSEEAVYGTSTSGIGIYGITSIGYAGWFDGPVHVSGFRRSRAAASRSTIQSIQPRGTWSQLRREPRHEERVRRRRHARRKGRGDGRAAGLLRGAQPATCATSSRPSAHPRRSCTSRRRSPRAVSVSPVAAPVRRSPGRSPASGRTPSPALTRSSWRKPSRRPSAASTSTLTCTGNPRTRVWIGATG